MKTKLIIFTVAIFLIVGFSCTQNVNAASRSLRLGMRGDDVKQLQTFLKDQGYLSGNYTEGYFGTKTKAAVQAFQSASSISSTGVVGPVTAAAVASSTTSGIGSTTADILGVMVEWQGEKHDSASETATDISNKLTAAADYWNKNSYGNIKKFTNYVYPNWIDITSETFVDAGVGSVGAAHKIISQLAVMNPGINLSSYKYIFVVLPRDVSSNASMCGFYNVGGVCLVMPGEGSLSNLYNDDNLIESYDSAKAIVINGDMSESTASTYAHELGHALGLYHFGDLSCTNDLVCGVFGSYYSYNVPSIMGHPNEYNILSSNVVLSAEQKDAKGWLSSDLEKTVTKTGTYTIHANDSSYNGPQTIVVPIDFDNGGSKNIFLDKRLNGNIYLEAKFNSTNPEAGDFDSIGPNSSTESISKSGGIEDDVRFYYNGETSDSLASVKITFPQKLTVKTSGAGTGTVAEDITGGHDKNCKEADGCYTYNGYTVVKLTATPDDDSYFDGWTTGDTTFTANPRNFTMNKDYTVTAKFELKKKLTINISPANSGSVLVSPAGDKCSPVSPTCYLYGPTTLDPLTTFPSVTLTPTPNAGYAFDSWSGGCSGSGSCSLTMNADHLVTANFVPLTLNISKTGTGTGSVMPSPTGSNTSSCVAPNCYIYNVGNSVALTATPSADSYFAGWTIDSSVFTDNSHSLIMNKPHAVTAKFDLKKKLTLTVNPSDAGSASVSPAGDSCSPANTTCHLYGPTSLSPLTFPSVSFSQSVRAGYTLRYTFEYWSGDCSGSGSCNLTMDSDRSVTANFNSSLVNGCGTPSTIPTNVVISGYTGSCSSANGNYTLSDTTPPWFSDPAHIYESYESGWMVPTLYEDYMGCWWFYLDGFGPGFIPDSTLSGTFPLSPYPFGDCGDATVTLSP